MSERESPGTDEPPCQLVVSFKLSTQVKDASARKHSRRKV